MKIEFKEIYPIQFPYYQLVGDEDCIFILEEWLMEEMRNAIFGMLVSKPPVTICRGPEVKYEPIY